MANTEQDLGVIDRDVGKTKKLARKRARVSAKARIGRRHKEKASMEVAKSGDELKIGLDAPPLR